MLGIRTKVWLAYTDCLLGLVYNHARFKQLIGKVRKYLQFLETKGLVLPFEITESGLEDDGNKTFYVR